MFSLTRFGDQVRKEKAMKRTIINTVLLATLVLAAGSTVWAQGTELTYQGNLVDGE